MRRMLRNLLLAALALLPAVASPHEMSMAEMDVREAAPGEFLWQWSATNDKRSGVDDLAVLWPASCAADRGRLDCGTAGLKGTLAVEGVGKAYSAALIHVYWLDGQSRVYTLTERRPQVQLYGSAEDRRGAGEIASTYSMLGVEHILSGVDHLLFVCALLFLVGFRRKLVWTITAFTVAHSLTLACASLGLVTLRAPPVEAIIALSIVLVAAEALSPRDTLARRWPAALAFLFGLVHGLGFAGALQEVGLPQHQLFTALLTFNLGVEMGQLLAVGAAWLVFRLLQRWPAAQALRTPLLYGIGSVAAFWSWLRVVAIAG
jgi:hydrogenase/urease accessory protein HupE